MTCFILQRKELGESGLWPPFLAGQGLKNLSFPVTKASATDDKVQMRLSGQCSPSPSPSPTIRRGAQHQHPCSPGQCIKPCPCTASGHHPPCLPPILSLLYPGPYSRDQHCRRQSEQSAILADFNITENNCVSFKSLLFWVSVRAAAYAA